MSRLSACGAARRRSLTIALVAGVVACKPSEPGGLDPVRAHPEPRRAALPAAGRRTTDRGSDRRCTSEFGSTVGRTASDAEKARGLGVDPAEFDWVRARIIEALSALDSRKVADAGLEPYTRAIASLREARVAAGDPRTAARARRGDRRPGTGTGVACASPTLCRRRSSRTPPAWRRGAPRSNRSARDAARSFPRRGDRGGLFSGGLRARRVGRRSARGSERRPRLRRARATAPSRPRRSSTSRA